MVCPSLTTPIEDLPEPTSWHDRCHQQDHGRSRTGGRRLLATGLAEHPIGSARATQVQISADPGRAPVPHLCVVSRVHSTIAPIGHLADNCLEVIDARHPDSRQRATSTALPERPDSLTGNSAPRNAPSCEISPLAPDSTSAADDHGRRPSRAACDRGSGMRHWRGMQARTSRTVFHRRSQQWIDHVVG